MTLAARNVTLAGRLAGVSATLEPGSITAICGPNGAGKSSLLKCLAGLLKPDSGELMLDGRPLSQVPASERGGELGYLPQTGEIAWDLSVEALVALGRLPHRDRGERQLAEALAALDLTALAHRAISTLSGGERARALLARVFAGAPRWILADEPLSALDLAHQLALLAHLRRAAQDGVGIVLVLHDLSLAMNHADRALVLSRGAVAAHGTPEQALSSGIVEQVWGIRATWLGEPGGRALVATSSPSGSVPPPGR